MEWISHSFPNIDSVKLNATEHDDVIKWKHFRVTGPLRGEFTGHRWIPPTKASNAEISFFLICALINAWINTRDAADLRLHCAHYDVTAIGQGMDEELRRLVLHGGGQCRTCKILVWFNFPWTKWLLFRKRYFQVHFREWKVLYFD